MCDGPPNEGPAVSGPTNKNIWDQAPSLTLRGITRNVPLRNFAGRNYMAYVDPILVAQLGIKRGERVVDIGGGAAPFSRADVVTEAHLEDDTHRIGKPIRKDREYVECFAEDLPFENGEFDVAVSRHVLEHASDPEAACREIARVARRGYIEVPSPWSECFYGYPPHRWMVSVEDGGLVFRRRPFVRSPFLNCLRWMEYRDSDFTFRWNLEHRNLITTQFPWEGEIPCRFESGPGFDYDDPEQAAESHLSFVINALRIGGVPPGELEYEIRAALRFQPENALALNALGIVLLMAERNDESRKAFGEACRLDPGDEVFRHNAQLSPKGDQPQLRLLPPEPVDAGTPRENFAGPVFHAPSSEHESALADQLNIEDGEKVLDIIIRGRPFERANIALDISRDVTTYHMESETVRSVRSAQSRSAALPFPDGSLDVAIVRGVLEHLDDPSKICAEVQRIARRGFIEVPHPCWEYVHGDPGHRWLCEVENGTLLFRRKPFAKVPFKGVIVPLLLKLPDLRRRFEVSLRNLTFIQLPWQGRFEYRVIDDPSCPYDYGHPRDALLAHLDHGFNLSSQGAAEAALREADSVLAIDGNHADGLNLRGVIAWTLGRHEEGLSYVRRAAEVAPNNKTITDNYRFMRDTYAEILAGDAGPGKGPPA